MIRVILKGRLGNNLFQYAIGRALSDKHAVPLVLDASKLRPKVWADSSSIIQLPLKAEILRKLSIPEKIIRKLTKEKRLTLRKMNIVLEGDNVAFDPTILGTPDDTLLRGYFQTPLYFENIGDKLRREIDLTGIAWLPPTRDFAARLTDSESVAVHIRRTDYLGSSEWNVCNIEYYASAMAHMKTVLNEPHFHIFSDDPEWCRTQFDLPDQTVVDFSRIAASPLHDLYLMSCARHHIIANSSYSWWAAWLGKKDGQRVLTPSKWTNDADRFPIQEKLCEGWQTLATTGTEQHNPNL